ncbi:MAG: hypothetical protein PHC68_15970 [Syntrophorhabdaceae bacterium]|nr:hypothetical protein [Syntrophorhabdaceae bacterium]
MGKDYGKVAEKSRDMRKLKAVSPQRSAKQRSGELRARRVSGLIGATPNLTLPICRILLAYYTEKTEEDVLTL